MKTKAYIARDKGGNLFIYTDEKPHRVATFWAVGELGSSGKISNHLFPDVKWDDEEPTEVRIEIVGEKAQQPQEQQQQREKFDPNTLKPFDKVLVRNDNDTWQVEFFSHICQHEPKGWCQCSGDSYYFCIPYNDETKNLVGTTEEAPEYYRYWEG